MPTTKLLIRCPKCGRENYALAVTSGVCCWCGHDANLDPTQLSQQLRVNNNACSAYVADKLPFTGSNLQATVEDGLYILYSYATPILFYDGESWVRNSTKYSVTTSKHLTQACARLEHCQFIPERYFTQQLQAAKDKQNELRHYTLD